jgi:hypothetical protein
MEKVRDDWNLASRLPYFLQLHGSYAEGDVEAAILREMEAFLLELGDDFTFVARQKRITVDNEDYYLDLLFFHRRLRRLVAVELKLGKFQAADKGQVELYLPRRRRQEGSGDVSGSAGARRRQSAGEAPARSGRFRWRRPG